MLGQHHGDVGALELACVGMVFPALLTRLGGVLSYPQMLGFGACVAVVTAVFVSVVSRHD